MVNKKAQFYLIAAIIIIGIIIILAGVSNYITTKEKPAKFYNLGEEFKEEGLRVVDYGIYNSAEPRDNIKLMENLSEQFADYTDEKDLGTELVFVFGNRTNLTSVTFTSENTGEVKLVVPGSSFSVPAPTIKHKTVNSTDTSLAAFDEVIISLLGQDYSFELHEGENFFFVISKNVTETEEIYIAKKT